MKNKIKRITAFVLILGILAGTCGCRFVIREEQVLLNPTEPGDYLADGLYQDEPGVINQEPELSGSLEIQIFTNESASSSAAWTAVIDAFEEATGVSVTAYIGSQVNTQMSKRWMGDNPPDIAFLDGSGIPVEALEASGALYDLTELLQEGYVYGTDDKIWDVVNHDIFERYDSESCYYRAGFMASAYGTFYDSNYLQQLGVEAPTNYDELMNTFLPAVREKGNMAFTTYGTTGSYPTWSMVMPAIAAYGQEYLDPVLMGTQEAWGREEVREVLQRWYDFCHADGALLTGTATYDHTTAQMKWLKHDSALIGNGIWLPWEVSNSTPTDFAMEYSTSPLTLPEQTPTVLAWPMAVILSSQSKNLENAKAFVRFLYTKQAQAVFISAYGYIGARTDLDYTQIPGLSGASKRILEYIYSNQVTLCWKRYTWGDLNDTVNGVVHGLMTGKLTVDQAVETLTTKGN